MASPEKNATIFLSYAFRDTPKAAWLAEFLEDVGFETVLDKENFLDELEGEDDLQMAISNADFFLACLSKRYKAITNLALLLKEKKAVPKIKLFQKEIAAGLRVSETKTAENSYFIIGRLENCKRPKNLAGKEFPQVDLFDSEGLELLVDQIKKGMASQGLVFEPRIRSVPRNDLTVFEAARLVRIKNFLHKEWNSKIDGFKSGYDFDVEGGEKVFIQQKTGLMWRRYVSNRFMEAAEARSHVEHLNQARFAGYNNWRLPTVDEALSLMQRIVDRDSFLHPRIHDPDPWILTADQDAGIPWVANFKYGICWPGHTVEGVAVRAVRNC